MKHIRISTSIFFLVLAGVGCEYHEYQTLQPSEPQQAASEGTSESEVIQPSAEESQNAEYLALVEEVRRLQDEVDQLRQGAAASGESEEFPSEEPSFSIPSVPETAQTGGPTYSPPGNGATVAPAPCLEGQARGTDGQCHYATGRLINQELDTDDPCDGLNLLERTQCLFRGKLGS